MSTSYQFEVATWYHVAATFSGTTMKTYVNGQFMKSGTTTAAKKADCVNIGVVCRATNNAGTSITGDWWKLNDVRIYSHAISEQDVKDLYNRKLFEVCGDLFLEQTDNISASKILTDTAFNGSLNKYGYNDASNLKKETVFVDGVECNKVTVRSGNTAVYPYVFFSPLHPLSGSWKTVSFDYYPTTQNSLIPYTYGGSAGATWISNYTLSGGNTTPGSSRTIPVNVGKWNHVSTW